MKILRLAAETMELRHAVSCGIIRQEREGALAETFLKLHIEALEEGGYVATSPDLPGLVAQGRTMSETVEIAHDVARKIIESYEEHGDPLTVGIRRPSKEMDIDIAVGIA
ncbi:MAG: type II toxin-antitoxin system HicB family antitoxin [Desulfobacterales bacterium]|nr:type II toxin-antitoxin system HicB family antitoxin [Desulfobacterales bacterium]